MHEAPNDATIVRSIIDLGHTLGLTTVAEGVETEAAMDQLQRLGCDVAQGYFVARPMPTASMAEWVRHHRLEAAGSPYGGQDRGMDARYGMTIPFDGR